MDLSARTPEVPARIGRTEVWARCTATVTISIGPFESGLSIDEIERTAETRAVALIDEQLGSGALQGSPRVYTRIHTESNPAPPAGL